MTKVALPIDAIMADAVAGLRSHGTIVLRAEPGAGKTTRFPLGLLADSDLEGTIVVVQQGGSRHGWLRIMWQNSWEPRLGIESAIGFVLTPRQAQPRVYSLSLRVCCFACWGMSETSTAWAW